ncbi:MULTISPECIES: hypothetical protein [unclassified Ruegeria]|uniref:hypothetical protein n=1 Tax=unclassified Ruegeria TaxID=2625375 RepID=UPI001487FDB6|nr:MULTISPECIES: hypothetical protein [unclassified Ruegeria]NOD76692.1 hypothetical protein [Ruegeria sp. HKCCD4332]NOD89412.1 hypothetical protein [Ruegeria sp. HKCCD4318]NOE13425.1 hypothetical protein [Ruegeria sp. HKCCD4318-2]NOG07826.1 hypothetical protein [Ruegeria sp. HKCCD4315]
MNARINLQLNQLQIEVLNTKDRHRSLRAVAFLFANRTASPPFASSWVIWEAHRLQRIDFSELNLDPNQHAILEGKSDLKMIAQTLNSKNTM